MGEQTNEQTEPRVTKEQRIMELVVALQNLNTEFNEQQLLNCRLRRELEAMQKDLATKLEEIKRLKKALNESKG